MWGSSWTRRLATATAPLKESPTSPANQRCAAREGYNTSCKYGKNRKTSVPPIEVHRIMLLVFRIFRLPPNRKENKYNVQHFFGTASKSFSSLRAIAVLPSKPITWGGRLPISDSYCSVLLSRVQYPAVLTVMLRTLLSCAGGRWNIRLV